jgi:hypothetical protein
MSYVVYHMPTTLLLKTWLARNGKPYRFLKKDRYASMRAANAALTRAKKALPNLGIAWGEFTTIHAGYFEKYVEKKEVRKGVVHAAGKEFVVGVNEPWTAGPWSETYWSS